MDGWMNGGGIDEWMDGRIKGQMNEEEKRGQVKRNEGAENE